MDYISAFRSALPSSAISVDSEILSSHGHDASLGQDYQPASIVVFPESDAEISIILEISNRFSIPIVPRGAGTGMTGGCSVIGPCIVLSFARMNRILELDLANRIAVVEPGVITGDLQELARSHGLYYPPDPASLDRCTIGGNVAENAGGPSAFKYGVTRQYVTGLSGFYADGTPFHLGGKLYKNVAGYDLLSLMVGQEGTLSVITKIYLRLIPYPRFRATLRASFSDYDQAIATLQAACTSSVYPAAAEFMDRTCVDAVRRHRGIEVPEGEAFVLFLLDGDQSECDVLREVCLAHGASNIEIALSDEDQDAFWKIRRSVSESLTAMSVAKRSHDIVVPPDQIGPYLKSAKALGEENGVTVLGYGHLADGNIHVNILQTGTALISESLTEKLLRLAVDMGGSITGEHGIGLTKKKYLNLMFSDRDIECMKAIKEAFDPKGLLNPGKIF